MHIFFSNSFFHRVFLNFSSTKVNDLQGETRETPHKKYAYGTSGWTYAYSPTSVCSRVPPLRLRSTPEREREDDDDETSTELGNQRRGYGGRRHAADGWFRGCAQVSRSQVRHTPPSSSLLVHVYKLYRGPGRLCIGFDSIRWVGEGVETACAQRTTSVCRHVALPRASRTTHCAHVFFWSQTSGPPCCVPHIDAPYTIAIFFTFFLKTFLNERRRTICACWRATYSYLF